MTSDQWRVKAAGQGSMEEGKAGKREDEKGGRGEERVVDCLNHRLHGLRRLHGLKLRDWIGRDVERSFCRDWYGTVRFTWGISFALGFLSEKSGRGNRISIAVAIRSLDPLRFGTLKEFTVALRFLSQNLLSRSLSIRLISYGCGVRDLEMEGRDSEIGVAIRRRRVAIRRSLLQG